MIKTQSNAELAVANPIDAKGGHRCASSRPSSMSRSPAHALSDLVATARLRIGDRL